MDYSFFDFLKLAGSLALFLYGMKIMSEGLQKLAGNKLRGIMSAMTKNRVMGVLTGVLVFTFDFFSGFFSEFKSKFFLDLGIITKRKLKIFNLKKVNN